MNVLNVKQKASVRWPFRVLASFIVLASLAVVGAHIILGGLHETTLSSWQFLAVLPGTAWLGRLAWYAAIQGKPPGSAHWPFASEQVLFLYVIALAVVSHA